MYFLLRIQYLRSKIMNNEVLLNFSAYISWSYNVPFFTRPLLSNLHNEMEKQMENRCVRDRKWERVCVRACLCKRERERDSVCAECVFIWLFEQCCDSCICIHLIISDKCHCFLGGGGWALLKIPTSNHILLAQNNQNEKLFNIV